MISKINNLDVCEINSRKNISKVPLLGTFLDLFFPNTCSVCDTLITSEKILCADCVEEIKNIKENFTYYEDIPYIDKVYAFSHKAEIVEKIIKKFKYYGKLELLPFIVFFIKKTIEIWELNDIIICSVPSHKAAMRYRGFSNTQLIIDFLMRKNTDENLKIRKAYPLKKIKRKYISQASLKDSKMREQNIKGAFALKDYVKYDKIYLFDDILTTGETIKEAAKTLKPISKKVNALILLKK